MVYTLPIYTVATCTHTVYTNTHMYLYTIMHTNVCFTMCIQFVQLYVCDNVAMYGGHRCVANGFSAGK